MKKIFAIAIAALFAVSANAQDCCKGEGGCCGGGFTPSWFVQFQGGIQLPNTPGMGDLTSPVWSLNVGRNVNPLMSVRLGIEGVNSKAYDAFTGVENEFKYATGSFDAMLNVTNLFTKKYCHPVNLYAFAGVGCNWSGMETTNSSKFSPNVRLGAQVDWRVSKNLALNLEYRADNTNDQFNGRLEAGTHDWYTSVLVGVSLIIPDAKKVVDRSAEIEALNARINAMQAENQALKTNAKKSVAPAPAPAPVEVVKYAQLPNVFFNCAKSNITLQQEANVRAIAEFLSANPAAKLTIKGYASPEGKKEANIRLSEARAKAVANMLINKYGVAADRITTEVGGPTSDIYPEKVLNRVAVSIAK